MASYTQQIATIDAKISSISAQIPALISSSKAWRADATNRCRGTKKKKAACEAEKARKVRRADSIMGTANAKKAEIARLVKSKASLVESQKAQDQATINLSTTGQSLEALVVKADGEAKALQTEAQITAQAEADSTLLKAQVDAQASTQEAIVDTEAKKQMNMLIMIVVGIVALIAIAFGVMKLKNMKK